VIAARKKILLRFNPEEQRIEQLLDDGLWQGLKHAYEAPGEFEAFSLVITVTGSAS